MTINKCWIAAAGLAGCLCISTAALGQTTAAPATAPQGAAVLSSVQVTATVTKIDHKTREVTLKAANGHEESLIVDKAVQNLDKVKKGDVVTATYTEALAYEVRKSGTPGADSVVAAAGAKPGEKPAGAIGQNTLVTVVITAIDPKAPSVTVKGPQGNTQTFKVASADKLKGVKVGDAVDLSYTEAVAVKVEKAAKQ
jgi:Cu/Ag efflux protein CusF